MKSDILELAIKIATDAHKGQMRKGGGEYITHPQAVAELTKTMFPHISQQPYLQVIAWLHDVIEDTDHTEESLIEAGIPSHYTVNVKTLSKRDGENYFDFIMRIKDSHHARKVKMADLKHNMSDLKEGSMKDKYRLAYHILEEAEKFWNKS
jgi:(p)ppGpp synthase/HD superfamily hydrolase